MTEEVKRSVGRPVNKNKLSSTERGKAADKKLRDEGGSVLSRVRLDKEATDALRILIKRDGSQRLAIQNALLSAAKNENSSEPDIYIGSDGDDKQ